MKARELQTAGDVIDALGGTAETARLTKRKSQHVSNWRAAGRLPPKTFLIVKKELAARGLTAPSRVWGIEQPETAA